jgi:hypothetical protein
MKDSPAEGKNIEVFLQPPGNKGMLFKPKVLKFDARKEFRWIGKLMGGGIFDGEHVFILKDNADSTCIFIQYERFRGILIPLMKKMLEGPTLSGFQQMNEALKKRCENEIEIHV